MLMAAALMVTHTTVLETPALPLWAQVPCGVVAGFGIGVVAAIMRVAGGELLIPTIVLLFAVDIKTAGSLSLLVSLPTMLVAFARYSCDGSFAVAWFVCTGVRWPGLALRMVAHVREKPRSPG
nr:hypothetical protein [Streptomyces agglomeratus]